MKLNSPNQLKAKMKRNFNLILASKSPRRFDLLKQAGMTFQVITENTEELTSYPDVEELVVLNAVKKAQAVAINHLNSVVIGADTIVVYDNTVIGKPKDEADAIAILQKLVGNTHTVITGVAICCNARNICDTFNVKSYVKFKKLSDTEIREYIKKVYVLDKAGAYAMQENSDLIVESYQGSFDNIVGLPIAEVMEHLAKI